MLRHQCSRLFLERVITARSFTIKELPHPHFKVNQRPEPFRVVFSTSLMSLDQHRNEVPIDTGKPILGRDKIVSGRTPSMLFLKTYFVIPPRSLSRSGRRQVNSTSL